MIKRVRQTRLHIAERTGTRARVAHDHEGRVLLFPALANIGAARFFADRDQTMFFDDAIGLSPFG